MITGEGGGGYPPFPASGGVTAYGEYRRRFYADVVLA